MSKLTTDNFWQAWAQPVPEPLPVFYRLYYNESGYPICYTMEDLPGNYIEIDRDMYVRGPLNVQVVDKKIIMLKKSSTVTKLQPGASGTACDPRDICVVVTGDNPYVYWSKKTHEIS